MVHRVGLPDAQRRFPDRRASWPLVARLRRHIVARLRRVADPGAAARRPGVGLVDRRLFTRIRRGAHYSRLQAAAAAKRGSRRPCRRSSVLQAGKPRRPAVDTTTQLVTDDGKSAWLSPPNRVCLSQPRRARASNVAGPGAGPPPTRASSIRSTRAWKKAFRRATRRAGPCSPELVRRNEADRRRGFTLSILRVAAFTNDPLRAHHGRRSGDVANSACELTVANTSYLCHDALVPRTPSSHTLL